MLRFTIKSWAILLLVIVIFLPITASAEASKDKAIDLSIIERSDALIPYMTTPQRIQFLKLEAAMGDAKSKRRSGQYLAETKPSTFDPDRNIKSIVSRGEQMIESADLSILTIQKEFVSLLTTVDAQRAEKETTAEARFDYVLKSSSFQEAMATECQQLLEKCWELGYEALFFDGVFTQDSEGTHRADAQLRNDFTTHSPKSMKHSVTIPVDFAQNQMLGQSTQIFSYENEAIFEQDKKALPPPN